MKHGNGSYFEKMEFYNEINESLNDLINNSYKKRKISKLFMSEKIHNSFKV